MEKKPQANSGMNLSIYFDFKYFNGKQNFKKLLDLFYLFHFSRIVGNMGILINLRTFRPSLHMYSIRNF